ncbi:MAG: hydroxypyruvate isomerase [Proteobacteria bacterium]|nr:hydroxypyruvate isomerase [Pseudomonadota bacterium]
MPKFAANISLMFPEVPFLERFAAARSAGFKAVEFQFPYAFAVKDIADRVKDNGLEVILFNLPPGDFDKGERGIACLPGREDEFRSGIGRMLEYAKAVNCRKINCLSGIKPQGLDREAALGTLASNLAIAADALGKEGVQLLVEPINVVDIPGFLLNRSSDGIAMLDRVGSSNIWLQYDVYHMQRMEGEISATVQRLLPRIGHIQIADAPQRFEPGTGEVNYRHVLNHIDAIGYTGWIGCEYKPRTTTVEGLRWIADHGFSL